MGRYKILLINAFVLSLASGCASQNVATTLSEPIAKAVEVVVKPKVPSTAEEATLEIAKSFEELKLGYSFKADEMRDCSGMFLRLSEQLKERFPQVLAPQAQDARSSRDIASWYADQDRLVEIEDPALARDLIHPGAVMFYAVKAKKGSGRISHIGVVTEVERDGAGHVTGYKLFHARGKGEIAAITGHHNLNQTPSLGNGKQDWVAMAEMLPGNRLASEFATIKANSGVRTTGIASWYGGKFMEGRTTASGEKFVRNELTAAHRSLPFGTVLEVTNLTNNKKVTVRVNDRGPMIEDRIIDLSEGAAKKIGLKVKGTAKVKIKVVEEATQA